MRLNNFYWVPLTFLILLIWIIIFMLNIFTPLLIPSPIEFFIELFKLSIEKTSILSFIATILRVITAFVISCLVGIIMGLLVGYYKLFDKLTNDIIDFFRSIPGIALFPLFILFFGINDVLRIMVALFVGIPVILLNTKYGVMNSKKHRLELGKVYRLCDKDMFKRIIIPEAAPYIFTGMRVTIALILILIIVTEMMLGTQYGLGQLIVTTQYQFETAKMLAVIFVLGMMGFGMNKLFVTMENKIFHWR